MGKDARIFTWLDFRSFGIASVLGQSYEYVHTNFLSEISVTNVQSVDFQTQFEISKAR